MWFWWFVLLCDTLIPVLMIIIGSMLWKHPPKQISGIIGYRTRRSTQSMAAWQFAQTHCGRLYWQAGWLMLPLSLLVHLPFYGASDNVLGIMSCVLCIMQLAVLLSVMLATEKALKNRFNANTQR